MKRCTRCNILMPESEFYRNKNTHDGLKPHCKKCERLDRRYPANPWRLLVNNARRRAARAGQPFDLDARQLPPRVPRCPVTDTPPTMLCRINPDISWCADNVVALGGWAAEIGVLDFPLADIQQYLSVLDNLPAQS